MCHFAWWMSTGAEGEVVGLWVHDFWESEVWWHHEWSEWSEWSGDIRGHGWAVLLLLFESLCHEVKALQLQFRRCRLPCDKMGKAFTTSGVRISRSEAGIGASRPKDSSLMRHDSSWLVTYLPCFGHILAHSGTWRFDSFDSWSDLFRSSQVSGALRGGLEMYPRISLEPQRSSCLSLRETGSAKNPWILQKWRWMLWIFVDDENDVFLTWVLFCGYLNDENDSWHSAETRLKQVESPESSCGTSAPSASVLPGAWWELCQLCQLGQLGRNIWPKYMPPN